MSGHTPGPWAYVDFDNVIVSGAGRILDVQPRSLHVSVEERNANGYLAAAAPELLEALQNSIAPFDGDSLEEIEDEYGAGTAKRVRDGRAAIAKATGATP